MLWRTVIVMYAAAITAANPRRAHAQGDDAAATHRGEFALRADGQLGLVMRNAAKQRAALAAADKIVAILRRDNALSAPMGYAVVAHRAAGVTGAGGETLTPGLPPHYGVLGAINYYALEDDGHGGQHVGDGGGSFRFSVIVNGVGRVEDAEQAAIPLDHGPPVLQDYRKTGEFRGHPVYNGECVLITRRPSVMPFIPLTKARYITLQLLKARADSARHTAEHNQNAGHSTSDALSQWQRDRPKREADMRATYDAVKAADPRSAQQFLDAWKSAEADAEARLRSAASSGADETIKQIERQGEVGEGANIAALQAQLAALSPAEHNAPAAIEQLGVDGERLTGVDNTASLPLVELNPAFFDGSLPPDTPQIVTVCLPGIQPQGEIERWESMQTDRSEWSDRRARDAARIRDQLDWAALEALVKP